MNLRIKFIRYDWMLGFDKPLRDMEKKIQGTIEKKMQSPEENEEIEIGDIVSAIVPFWHKWIRVQIKEKDKNGFYSVWAIDYGVPMISKPSQIIKLPPMYAKMNMKNPRIHLGGLRNCIPAETIYDLEKNNNVLIEKSNWTVKSIEIAQKLISNAIQLQFEDVVELVSMNRPHSFGTLKVQKPDGSWIDLNQCLATALVAKTSNDNWKAQVHRFESIRQDEWKTMDGKHLEINFVVLPGTTKKFENDIASNQSNVIQPVNPQPESKQSINSQPVSSQSENEQPVNINPECNNGQNSTKQSGQTNDTVLPNGSPQTRPPTKRTTTMKSNRNWNNLPNQNQNPNFKSRNAHLKSQPRYYKRNDYESQLTPRWHTNGKFNNRRYREEVEFFESSFRKPTTPVKQEDSSSEDSLVIDEPSEKKTTANEANGNGTMDSGEKSSGETKSN